MKRSRVLLAALCAVVTLPLLGVVGIATAEESPWTTDEVFAPPAEMVVALEDVWHRTEGKNPALLTFPNYGFDQVMAGGGTVDYCVRWESSAEVSVTLRDQIHTALSGEFNEWMAALSEDGQGWNGWPYPHVDVNVVGWAVADRDVLKWTDDELPVTVGLMADGVPICDEATSPFTMSLWLTAGLPGGFGGDWGQHVGSEYLTGQVGGNPHILTHEIGHTFGLDDFYDFTPTGQCCFIMNAGSAVDVTEFDKWMLRDFWRHLKDRYDL